MTIKIPTDFEVQPVPENWPGAATCGSCGLSWDDSVSTGYTPAPSGRCPFEAFHEEEIDTRPILDIAHNGARWHIGVTELDDRGYGVRAYVISAQDEYTVDVVMFRRFRDIARLMGDKVQIREGCEQYLNEGL